MDREGVIYPSTYAVFPIDSLEAHTHTCHQSSKLGTPWGMASLSHPAKDAHTPLEDPGFNLDLVALVVPCSYLHVYVLRESTCRLLQYDMLHMARSLRARASRGACRRRGIDLLDLPLPKCLVGILIYAMIDRNTTSGTPT